MNFLRNYSSSSRQAAAAVWWQEATAPRRFPGIEVGKLWTWVAIIHVEKLTIWLGTNNMYVKSCSNVFPRTKDVHQLLSRTTGVEGNWNKNMFFTFKYCWPHYPGHHCHPNHDDNATRQNININIWWLWHQPKPQQKRMVTMPLGQAKRRSGSCPWDPEQPHRCWRQLQLQVGPIIICQRVDNDHNAEFNITGRRVKILL